MSNTETKFFILKILINCRIIKTTYSTSLIIKQILWNILPHKVKIEKVLAY